MLSTVGNTVDTLHDSLHFTNGLSSYVVAELSSQKLFSPAQATQARFKFLGIDNRP